MTISEAKIKFEFLRDNVENIANEIIESDEEVLVQIQNEQLWAGKDNQGNDLTPSYLDDPYFKTKEAAQNYSDWKDRITPGDSMSGLYPDRKKGTPNLFINGYYYGGIRFDPKGGLFLNKSLLNSAISDKYPNALGLNETGIKGYALNYFIPQFFKRIQELL